MRQKRVKMSTDGTSNSKHTAAEQLFIDRLASIDRSAPIYVVL
jgi:hypothetical protein